MVPPLYCRWRDCGKTHQRVAGMMPGYCPECGKPAMWTTNKELAGRFVDPNAGKPDEPTVKYELGYNDKRFLRSIKIAWREEPEV